MYRILTKDVLTLFWIDYVIFHLEYGDIEGILVFAILNVMFSKLLKCYAAGDMKIMFAVLPILAIQYTGIELLEMGMLLFILANIVFIIQKLYDKIVYKKKLGAPKEFVPAILMSTVMMFVIRY